MKQRVQIIADDGDTRISIMAIVVCRKNRNKVREGMSADEQRSIKRTLQRRIADGVRGITYTDFGPENTKIG